MTLNLNTLLAFEFQLFDAFPEIREYYEKLKIRSREAWILQNKARIIN